mmetsp:Transcript_14793/g.62417  ORF Transcript_14793/g.62417 Transcript_14793/m.62417 type:complete len:355 (-) Transcript_14793:1160-2224(-)
MEAAPGSRRDEGTRADGETRFSCGRRKSERGHLGVVVRRDASSRRARGGGRVGPDDVLGLLRVPERPPAVAQVRRRRDVRRPEPAVHGRASVGERHRVRAAGPLRARGNRDGRQGERQDRRRAALAIFHPSRAARRGHAPRRELHEPQRARSGGGEAVWPRTVLRRVPRQRARRQLPELPVLFKRCGGGVERHLRLGGRHGCVFAQAQLPVRRPGAGDAGELVRVRRRERGVRDDVQAHRQLRAPRRVPRRRARFLRGGTEPGTRGCQGSRERSQARVRQDRHAAEPWDREGGGEAGGEQADRADVRGRVHQGVSRGRRRRLDFHTRSTLLIAPRVVLVTREPSHHLPFDPRFT